MLQYACQLARPNSSGGTVGEETRIWTSAPARRPGFDSRDGVWTGVSVPHMWRLAVPLEQSESSSALVQTDMVLNPQPTDQPTAQQSTGLTSPRRSDASYMILLAGTGGGCRWRRPRPVEFG